MKGRKERERERERDYSIGQLCSLTTESCSRLCIRCNVEIGCLVQGLVAKVKDTVANGCFG